MMDLPATWANAPLGELIAHDGIFTDGDWVESKDQDPSGSVRLIQLADIGDSRFVSKSSRFLTREKADELNCTFLKKGDLLVARMPDPLGRCCLFPLEGEERFVTVVDVCALRLGSASIEPRYLMWAINSPTVRGMIAALQSGSTRKRISRGNLATVPIPIPPLNEQRRIVEKIEARFDEIEKGVESLKTAKTTLSLYRQSLLKSAFEGRLTANWRARNADNLEAPETLLARIQAEREIRYKAALDDWQEALTTWRAAGEKGRKPVKPKRPAGFREFDFTDLRQLPDGWVYLPFEGLAWSIRNGISAKPDEKGPLKIFRISAVRPMSFDLEDFRRITDLNGSFADYRLVHGDLVFTRYNGSRDYVGVSAMYRGDGTHVYPDKLIRCEIKSDILNPAFLEAATNCGESRAYIERRIRTTAGQSGISGGDIKSMPVPICSPTEQAEIVRILDARLDAADALETEIDAALTRANALRQSILKKAFSGQLVPQDPDDEPAAALLERIKAERAKAPKSRTKRVQA